MKKSENLSQMSNEELEKSYKVAKGAYIGFVVIFALLVLVALYITVKKGFGVFTMLPLAFIPILIGNIFNYGKIKEEMKNRNLI